MKSENYKSYNQETIKYSSKGDILLKGFAKLILTGELYREKLNEELQKLQNKYNM